MMWLRVQIRLWSHLLVRNKAKQSAKKSSIWIIKQTEQAGRWVVIRLHNHTAP